MREKEIQSKIDAVLDYADAIEARVSFTLRMVSDRCLLLQNRIDALEGKLP